MNQQEFNTWLDNEFYPRLRAVHSYHDRMDPEELKETLDTWQGVMSRVSVEDATRAVADLQEDEALLSKPWDQYPAIIKRLAMGYSRPELPRIRATDSRPLTYGCQVCRDMEWAEVYSMAAMQCIWDEEFLARYLSRRGFPYRPWKELMEDPAHQSRIRQVLSPFTTVICTCDATRYRIEAIDRHNENTKRPSDKWPLPFRYDASRMFPTHFKRDCPERLEQFYQWVVKHETEIRYPATNWEGDESEYEASFSKGF